MTGLDVESLLPAFLWKTSDNINKDIFLKTDKVHNLE